MIFLTVGSREYQFDRLLKKVDELCKNEDIQEEVFGQIGNSNYIPQNFQFERYLSTEEYQNNQSQADIVISHAGTGALIGAIKKGKQVIAIPRLAKYAEHADDHQIQVADALEKKGYLITVTDLEELNDAILSLKNQPINKIYNEPTNVIKIINNFISEDKNN